MKRLYFLTKIMVSLMLWPFMKKPTIHVAKTEIMMGERWEMVSLQVVTRWLFEDKGLMAKVDIMGN